MNTNAKAPVRRRGRPLSSALPVIDRDRLLSVLLDLVRREGLESVNMRRVAADANVSVRLLYDHVRDKAELIDLACDVITAQAVPSRLGGDWRQRLIRLARATRKAFATYPGLAAIVLNRVTSVPAQSQAGQLSEEVLGALVEAGLAGKPMEAAYLAYAAYTMGHLAISEGSSQSAKRMDDLFNRGLDMLLAGFAAAGAKAADN